MSMFKKMKEKLEKVSEEYRAKEVDLLNELCEHLREIGVNGTVHVSENWKAFTRAKPISHIIGYVKVEDRNIDSVQLEMKQHMSAEGEVEYFEYFYYYIVEANVKGLEGKLKAEVEPVKKGFLSREVVDFRWEGGELAQSKFYKEAMKNEDMEKLTKLIGICAMLLQTKVYLFWSSA